ncbi:hypothetical protein N657DRAFT_630886 [Parathielavia appendiculata]|uniref:Uncharacterized protein n=1 Tax=Parathielavia appendiculata TaxID=2587402 RepID=A0AAN6Z714_9PEZI|nr:hypothetical protein N657DRAFT_630886 [Parathielavia appendiculata]
MYLIKSVAQYWAWFGWWPNQPTYFSDVVIYAGDTVGLNIAAQSLTSATLSLVNTCTGQLDRANVTMDEWIFEDSSASNGVPLADFATITFSGTRFVTDTGVTGRRRPR